MLIHKDIQSMKYSKDKSKVYKLKVGKQKTRDSKKRYTRTSRLKKENWNTASLFHRTEKVHKITEKKKKKKKNVSRRYNSSSSGTKSKHGVETIGSLKTSNNGKCSQFKKPENTSIHRKRNLSTEENLDTTNWQEMTRQ